MSLVFNNPVAGVMTVVLAGILLFAPTLVARFRKIRAFRSVSALNALAFLVVAGVAVQGLLSGGLSSPGMWAVAVTWGGATIWSFLARRRDDP